MILIVFVMILFMYLINYTFSFFLAYSLFPITKNIYLNGFLVMASIETITRMIMSFVNIPLISNELQQLYPERFGETGMPFTFYK